MESHALELEPECECEYAEVEVDAVKHDAVGETGSVGKVGSATLALAGGGGEGGDASGSIALEDAIKGKRGNVSSACENAIFVGDVEGDASGEGARDAGRIRRVGAECARRRKPRRLFEGEDGGEDAVDVGGVGE